MPEYTSAAGTFEVNRPLWLEIDGVPLATPAWRCVNPLGAVRSGGRRNTGGLVIPRSTGRLARRMWQDASQLTLEVQVYGTKGMVGDPTSSVLQGVLDNLLFLDANIGALPATDDSTREAVLHMPDGTTTYSGPVQVEEFAWPDDVGDGPAMIPAALTLFIPAGRLAEDA